MHILHIIKSYDIHCHREDAPQNQERRTNPRSPPVRRPLSQTTKSIKCRYTIARPPTPPPHSKPSNYSLPQMALAIPGGPRFCGVQEIAAASKELLLTLDRLHNCVVSRFTLSRVMESRSCPWGHHKEKLWPQYSDTIISFIVLCQICDQLLQSMSRNALHWYARTTIG